MRSIARFAIGIVASLLALGSIPALAQTFDSGSTGADGPLNITSGTTTLTLPDSGVFNFTTVTVSSGATLKFTPNATNTPVTMLASGDVTISGTIDVSGSPGGPIAFTTLLSSNGGAGGPGGSDGGAGANGIVSTTGGNGQGPGGGGGSTAIANANLAGAGGAGFVAAGANGTGTLGTPGAGGIAYGAPTLLPLIGGSGGGGGGATFGNTGGGGGGGGGAIIIASSGTITLSSTGKILAKGADGASSFGNGGVASGGGGSGGAVRLVATSLAGSGGQILVTGADNVGVFNAGSGSDGRVRLEAFTDTLSAIYGSVPPNTVSSGPPSSVVLTNAPTLTITAVAGVAAPAAPTASFSNPDITLPAGTINPVTVDLAGANIPVGTVVTVTVAGQVGSVSSTTTTLQGTQESSTAQASLTIPTDQPSIISASASFTILASSGGGPVFVQGEEVERVRVTATFGGRSQVAYITRSGREVVLTPLR